MIAEKLQLALSNNLSLIHHLSATKVYTRSSSYILKVNSFRFCILAYYLLFPYGESHILAAFLARLAKGNVSFCHHLASSSVNFSHFNLLL